MIYNKERSQLTYCILQDLSILFTKYCFTENNIIEFFNACEHYFINYNDLPLDISEKNILCIYGDDYD